MTSGVARVSYDGRSIEYRSLAEIDRAIEALDREIAVINRAAVINHPGTDHQWNMNGHCALCGIADIA